jgi:peroxiredoxin
MISKKHFVGFAAVYSKQSPPTLIVDVDQNGVLECEEQVQVIQHPRDPDLLFRTVILQWNDEGPERRQRYRVRLPVSLDGDEPRFSVDLVDAPVARWTQDDRTVVWILYDGNYDGVYGGKFGDGILIDKHGIGQFDLDQSGNSFYSYHQPIDLPWGTFSVIDADPEGRYVGLQEVAEEDIPSVYAEGDAVPTMECLTLDGETIRFGGESDRHQVLFFWLSTCASCAAEAVELVPLAERLGADRVTVVGINMDETRGESDEFIRLTGASWPNCHSGKVLWDNAIARQFNVDNPSDYVVIDPSGRIALKGNGVYILEGLLEEAVLTSESFPADGTDHEHDHSSHVSTDGSSLASR